jgi:hypothetical protein
MSTAFRPAKAVFGERIWVEVHPQPAAVAQRPRSSIAACSSAVCTDGSGANPEGLAAAARACQTDGSTRPPAN